MDKRYKDKVSDFNAPTEAQGVYIKDKKTHFTLWAPSAEDVVIKLYSAGDGECFIEEHHLSFDDTKNLWILTIEKDLHGVYYTFSIKHQNEWLPETADPSVKTTGVNGLRGMVVDPERLNPFGWGFDKRVKLENYTDAIIYELHVRDFTSLTDSNNSGQFSAIYEEKHINYLKDLGITHIHLLPISDYYTVDESNPKLSYNWGYDPQHFNSIEGSYSSDPYNGEVRIEELKKLVAKLHENGIGVILDVVYNHTGLIHNSSMNMTAPGCYYRLFENGQLSNASGCGNEIASEREAVRQFIIESLKYWAEEFHIDGFRFDLMGILDIQTMNMIRSEMDKISKNIILYGEGWTADYSPLPEDLRAVQRNSGKLRNIASFNDSFRDGIKGSTFNSYARGFISGSIEHNSSIKHGLSGATPPQKNGWAPYPSQSINYSSCHDNLTLYDKLSYINRGDKEQIIKEAKLAFALVLTAQGVPFIHAGSEFLRTKHGDHNSYRSLDNINGIDWSLADKHSELVETVKALIKLRKAHPALRLRTTEMVRKHIKFNHSETESVIKYSLNSCAEFDSWNNILILFNGSKYLHKVSIPEGEWELAFNTEKREDKVGLHKNYYSVAPTSMVILKS